MDWPKCAESSHSAVTMNDRVALIVEVDEDKIDRRIRRTSGTKFRLMSSENTPAAFLRRGNRNASFLILRRCRNCDCLIDAFSF